MNLASSTKAVVFKWVLIAGLANKFYSKVCFIAPEDASSLWIMKHIYLKGKQKERERWYKSTDNNQRLAVYLVYDQKLGLFSWYQILHGFYLDCWLSNQLSGFYMSVTLPW